MIRKTLALAVAAWMALSATALAYDAKKTYLDCSVSLKEDVLVVENARIRRTYSLNGGNLATTSIENKSNGYVWKTSDMKPDMVLPGQSGKFKCLSFEADIVPETASRHSFLSVTIVCSVDKLEIKRVLRLYPECPAIASDFFFKGEPAADWYDSKIVHDSIPDLRFVRMSKAEKYVPTIDQFSMPGKQWRFKVVELMEMTDHLDNLVCEQSPISFFKRIYRGNLLFAENMEESQGLFFMKEAPSPNAQLKYPGGDYLTAFGHVGMIGFGLGQEDIKSDRWTKGYSAVLGVYDGSEYSALASLKTYQEKLRKHDPARDDMVMMNTWGDRNDATKNINERYILEELEMCARLGITHYQLDYGWQTDRASLPKFGSQAKDYRDNEQYWLPDRDRFPNGFTPIVKKAKELGIEICLWFEPNYNDNYRRWKQDADWLVRLNKLYGIRTFKIDGLRIHNKTSEERVDSLFLRLSDALGNDLCINLDVTADKRFGYLYKNGYGNIFLENRYTDWGNYFPFRTLRNLWMLSKYVPPQNIQLEFLNKWRFADQYEGRFAPANYDFEYLFAITMMAQPLAWMHSHNLPPEGFEIAPVIKNYKNYQGDIHKGKILPIGEEPSGESWTGFQSIQDGEGYFLVYRESNDRVQARLKTWLQPGARIRLQCISGSGQDFSAKADSQGRITFSLEKRNSYSLYRYEIDAAVDRAQVIENMQKVMGAFPGDIRSKFKIHSTENLKCDSYERSSISFEVAPGETVHAYLYKPSGKREKYPAILALHSTGAAGKKIIDGDPPVPNRQYARELAERGYVVIAPDYPGFGESSDYDFSTDRYDSGTMKGICNHMSCVSLLQSLPYVDKERIGVIGHSLGGHNAIFAAVFDPRIKVIVSSCGWTLFSWYDAGDAVTATYSGRLGPWAQERYMPGFRTVCSLDPDRIPFDFDDLIASLAPRPFFSNSPIHDTNFHIGGVKVAAQRIAKTYGSWNASDRFVVVHPDCGHDFPPEIRQEAYDFLAKYL